MYFHTKYNKHNIDTWFTHRRFILCLESDTLNEIEQQLAGHGLNADGKSLIMDVLREEKDGHREVLEGEAGSDVVD